MRCDGKATKTTTKQKLHRTAPGPMPHHVLFVHEIVHCALVPRGARGGPGRWGWCSGFRVQGSRGGLRREGLHKAAKAAAAREGNKQQVQSVRVS